MVTAARERAEAERDAEHVQADALRDRIEALQEQLDRATRARLEVEALRQRDAERWARGRWARLRAAWRGE